MAESVTDKDTQKPDVDLDTIVAMAVDKARAAYASAVPDDDDAPTTTTSAPEPEPEPEPNYEELFSDGRYSEAIDALRKSTAAETTRSFAPLIKAQADSARRLVHADLEKEFGAEEAVQWIKRAEKEARDLGYDPNTFVDPSAWRKAVGIAQSGSIDQIRSAIRDQERERLRQELTREPMLAAGSLGPEATSEQRNAYTALDERTRATVDRLGFDPEVYKRNLDVIENYAAGDGSVNDCTILDEDIPFNERRTRELNIEPGKF